jgi:hypothetical protein
MKTFSVLAEKDCSTSPTQKTETLRLKEDILRDYDSTVRPVIHHSSQTVVHIAMFLRSINFVSNESHNFRKLLVICFHSYKTLTVVLYVTLRLYYEQEE